MSNSIFSQFFNENARRMRSGMSNKTEMSRDEAYEVLGLKAGASIAEINAAYFRLVQSVHPDKGGSSYLTQKLTQARKLLIGSK